MCIFNIAFIQIKSKSNVSIEIAARLLYQAGVMDDK